MKRILAAIAALFIAFGALAQARVASDGKSSVRITLDVCTAQPVLALIPEIYRNVVRDATSTLDGKEWHACWFMDGDKVHLLYEDGDQGLMPFSWFKLEENA
jgi:hypothetical protein